MLKPNRLLWIANIRKRLKTKLSLTLSPMSNALKSLIGRISTSRVSKLISTRPFLSPGLKKGIKIPKFWASSWSSGTYRAGVLNGESLLIGGVADDVVVVCLELDGLVVVAGDFIEPADGRGALVDESLSGLWWEKTQEFELWVGDVVTELEALWVLGEPGAGGLLWPARLLGTVHSRLQASRALVLHAALNLDGVFVATAVGIDPVLT